MPARTVVPGRSEKGMSPLADARRGNGRDDVARKESRGVAREAHDRSDVEELRPDRKIVVRVEPSCIRWPSTPDRMAKSRASFTSSGRDRPAPERCEPFTVSAADPLPDLPLVPESFDLVRESLGDVVRDAAAGQIGECSLDRKVASGGADHQGELDLEALFVRAPWRDRPIRGPSEGGGRLEEQDRLDRQGRLDLRRVIGAIEPDADDRAGSRHRHTEPDRPVDLRQTERSEPWRPVERFGSEECAGELRDDVTERSDRTVGSRGADALAVAFGRSGADAPLPVPRRSTPALALPSGHAPRAKAYRRTGSTPRLAVRRRERGTLHVSLTFVVLETGRAVVGSASHVAFDPEQRPGTIRKRGHDV